MIIALYYIYYILQIRIGKILESIDSRSKVKWASINVKYRTRRMRELLLKILEPWWILGSESILIKDDLNIIILYIHQLPSTLLKGFDIFVFGAAEPSITDGGF